MADFFLIFFFLSFIFYFLFFLRYNVNGPIVSDLPILWNITEDPELNI